MGNATCNKSSNYSLYFSCFIHIHHIPTINFRYIAEHSARMRADALTRFEGKFTASRRVLLLEDPIQLHPHQMAMAVGTGDSGVTSETHKVVLRYFQCRGRAEPFRFVRIWFSFCPSNPQPQPSLTCCTCCCVACLHAGW
jgi:hypothetical protein